MLAVWLLYLLVARYFGRAAGLVAALALTVSPVSVAVNRDNNPDALFALLLGRCGVRRPRGRSSPAGCAGCSRRAVLDRSRLQHEDARGGIVVPGHRARLPASRAAALAAAHRAPARGRHRRSSLVSGAWIAAVELTPAADRPYVGSTSEQQRAQPRARLQRPRPGHRAERRHVVRRRRRRRHVLRDARLLPADQQRARRPGRLAARRSRSWAASRRSSTRCAPGAARARRLSVSSAAGSSRGAVVFSYSSGIVHTYYLSALAPGTCALVGIGAVSLSARRRRGGAWLALPSPRSLSHRVARGRAAAADELRAVAAEPRRLRRVRRSGGDRGARGRAGLVARNAACDRNASARDESRAPSRHRPPGRRPRFRVR